MVAVQAEALRPRLGKRQSLRGTTCVHVRNRHGGPRAHSVQSHRRARKLNASPEEVIEGHRVLLVCERPVAVVLTPCRGRIYQLAHVGIVFSRVYDPQMLFGVSNADRPVARATRCHDHQAAVRTRHSATVEQAHVAALRRLGALATGATAVSIATGSGATASSSCGSTNG